MRAQRTKPSSPRVAWLGQGGKGEEKGHESPAGTGQPFHTCLIWRAPGSPGGAVAAAVAVETVCVFHAACDTCEGEQSTVWQHGPGGDSAGSSDGGHGSSVGLLLVTAVTAGPRRAVLSSSGRGAGGGLSWLSSGASFALCFGFISKHRTDTL